MYDVALNANFEIIERHKHTKVIKGSLAEKDRDATVKWNYIDLRFKSNNAFRIDIELGAEKLIVKYLSTESVTHTTNQYTKTFKANKLNDCYSCGNVECFKHPHPNTLKQASATLTTFILDDKWSEYDAYIKSISYDKDFFIIPILKNKFFKTSRYDWTIKNPDNAKSTLYAALNRAVKLRYISNLKTMFFQLCLNSIKK